MSQRARARRGSQVAAVSASPRQRHSVRRTESETAKKYRLLADSVADVIFLLDMDLKPTYFSPSATRLTGRRVEELMSGTLEGTITPASYEAAVKALKEAKADEKREPGSVTSRSLELELILNDGSTKLAEATASYLRDVDGTPIGIVGTLHDITERSKAEEARRESEKRYQLLADNITDVICTLDKDLVVTYLSPSVNHLLGYTVEQSLGQHWTQFIEEALTPESAKVATGIFREIDANMDDRSQDTYKSWTLELEFNRKDGSTLWTEGRVSILRSAEGKPIGFLAIVRDINERRRAQELFKTLANNSPIAVYIVQGGKLQFVNSQFQHQAGAGEAELLGTDGIRFVLPDDRGTVKQMAEAMLKGERRNPYEYRFVGHSERIKWVMEQVASIQHNGRPAVLGTFMDITERKHSEENLVRSESQLRLLSQRILEVQEEERARIARELHDQLGQELVALKIEAVVLMEELAKSPRLRERARGVVDLIERLDTTAHRIAVSIRPEILDKLGLVKAIQWYAEDFERRSGISCPVEAPNDELVLPKAVSTCAYRILQEALVNVWKHSRASQAKVKVTGGHGVVNISVSDNGVGMDLGRLSEGTSLGLLGMRERASLVGGKVSIRRNAGGGLRVTTSLPVSAAQTGMGTGAEMAAVQTVTQKPWTKSAIRVLLVDDHSLVRAGLRRVLEQAPDIRIIAEACDGREAVDKYQEVSPDVVVMDISMPELDGMEASKRILSVNPQARILMLTRFHEEQYAIRTLKAGCLGYLTKGSSTQQLHHAVRAVARGKRFLSEDGQDVVNLQLLSSQSGFGLLESLSDRELQVLCLLAQGQELKGVAADLELSVKTVETYRARVLHKLHLRNDVDICQFAIQHGLIDKMPSRTSSDQTS
jgi:two-component system invasion response regulator UvrY